MKKLLNVVALLLVMGCTGIKVRENVQMPTMAAAYEAVIQPHIERGALVHGIAVPSSAGALLTALQSGQRSQVVHFVPAWRSRLRVLFMDGLKERVRVGELGRQGALIMADTALRFDVNMSLLVAR